MWSRRLLLFSGFLTLASGWKVAGPVCEPFGRASVIAAIDALREGRPICVTDDESRENEGDLIMAAEHATPETVGFIVRHSSGVICVAVPDERLKELEMP